MTGSNEQCKTKKKKKKQKLDGSEKNIAKDKEPWCHDSERLMKKKRKKKASAVEDVSETKDVVPKKKKKNNVVLDKDMSSNDPKANGDVPREETTLDEAISSGDPMSTWRTQQKNKNVLECSKRPQANDGVPKKKTAIHEEISSGDPTPAQSLTCDPPTDEDDPKDAASCEFKTIDSLCEKKAKNTSLADTKDTVTKKKKRKKFKAAENNSEDQASKSGIVVIEVNERKKKKKKVYELEEMSGPPVENQPEMFEKGKVKKKKKRKKTTSEEPEVVIVLDDDQEEDSLRVSKKKKGSKIDIESGVSKKMDKDSGIASEGGSKKKKKKKKKKRLSKVKETAEAVEGTDKSLAVTCPGQGKKKSKKRKKQEMMKLTDSEHLAEEDVMEVPKKKKNKEDTADSEEEKTIDIQTVSAQDRNTDEVHIDMAKRKSLQQDIDIESGKTKGTRFGQWDTATFQNSERQTKFFRLLGGFKKDNEATLPSASHQVKANMAPEEKQEAVIKRNLLTEFNKAVSWKQNRGIGLGFQPAQGKSFFIDKTASRSLKFED